MRALFWILVLGNVAFFAWYHYLRAPVSPAAHIGQVQMVPEKIRVVAAPPKPAPAATAGADDAKPMPATTPATPCLSWGPFIGPQDAARADALLAEARLPLPQVRRVISDVDGHWVLIPPQKTPADIARVLDNLKRAGIGDYNVVTEPPQWRNAISLGIFRTQEAARALLVDAQNKGVTDAVLERRERFFQQLVYYVRDPDDVTVARLTAVRMRMPGSEVKAVACPAQ